jgi:hypothetical protein
MVRRPDDREPEPPGGRAAERLREYIDQRFPTVPEGAPEAIRKKDGDRETCKPDEESTGTGGEQQDTDKGS